MPHVSLTVGYCSGSAPDPPTGFTWGACEFKSNVTDRRRPRQEKILPRAGTQTGLSVLTAGIHSYRDSNWALSARCRRYSLVPGLKLGSQCSLPVLARAGTQTGLSVLTAGPLNEQTLLTELPC